MDHKLAKAYNLCFRILLLFIFFEKHLTSKCFLKCFLFFLNPDQEVTQLFFKKAKQKPASCLGIDCSVGSLVLFSGSSHCT